MEQSDRDLLIKLSVQVEQLIKDIKELKDTTSKRVDILETEKESKTEVSRLWQEANKIHDDHETRIRSVENIFESFKGKYAILAVIGTALVSVVITWISKKL